VWMGDEDDVLPRLLSRSSPSAPLERIVSVSDRHPRGGDLRLRRAQRGRARPDKGTPKCSVSDCGYVIVPLKSRRDYCSQPDTERSGESMDAYEHHKRTRTTARKTATQTSVHIARQGQQLLDLYRRNLAASIRGPWLLAQDHVRSVAVGRSMCGCPAARQRRHGW
jgi:hypothetical protein